MSVDGNTGRPVDARAIDARPQVHGLLPGAVERGTPSYPDVGAAEPARACRHEVETELVRRKRRVHLTGGRVDRRAQVLRLGPLGVGEGHGPERSEEHTSEL